MKIFISWSGDLSHDIALILRDWIPTVLHSIDPWVSSEDISKGGRWSDEITAQLEACPFGIICVTPHNAASPWLNFEAGALSRTLPDARVAPFLFGMSAAELTGPLAQFQVSTPNKTEIQKLLESINKSMSDDAVPVERLRKTFDFCWPGLEAALNKLESPPRKAPTSIPRQVKQSNKSEQKLQQVEEKILIAIATGVERSDDNYIALKWVCSQVEVTPTRGKYHVEQMQKKGFVNLDSDDDCYLISPGRAYLIEHDLIE